MAKSKKQIAADETASRKEREALALEANKKRNEEQLSRRNAIADASDAHDPEKLDLEEVSDEAWAEEDNVDRGDDEEAEGEEKTGDDAEAVRQAQADEDANDVAREAGAEDSRKRKDGVVEYKLTVNGKVRWQTLKEIRDAAQKVESADEYLQQATDGVRRLATDGHADDDAEALRTADAEAAADLAARREHLKDLYRRAAVGDEEAIDELAQLQAGLPRVTPDVLRTVDERVDARMKGRQTFEDAVVWFESEYATELSSPLAKQIAGRRDAEIAGQNPKMPPRERLKKVGDELRQLRKELGAPLDGSAKPNKQQRKEDAPALPTAAGRQRPAGDEEEAETPGTAIERMAKARGQARAIKH